MPEEERSYVIVRHDGLILHTKPITEGEAMWLVEDLYKSVKSRAARVRYLEEWGNVLDVGDSVNYLRQQLERLGYNPYYYIGGIYRDPEELAKDVAKLRRLRRLPPEVKQMAGELLDKIKEFLREPVEPKPITAPVRYYEMDGRHVGPDPRGGTRTYPKSDWHALKYDFSNYSINLYGVSVYDDMFLMWRQENKGVGYTWMILVERGASDREVIDAVIKDEAVQEFLRESARHLEEVVREREAEMVSRGYGDVVRKAKLILAAAALLTAGRREEEGEALPA